MSSQVAHAVTGAFGYTGQHIARRLLDAGYGVRTLTNSPQRPSSLAGRVTVHGLHFDDPAALTDALSGVDVLHNTYWVRFNHKRFRHADAIENTKTLFNAAAAAGVRRIVHVSITNPSPDSPFEYFRGKAELERALAKTGVPHTILRPAVLFGGDDILIANIAWMLRRFPIFAMFGNGEYRLQPIHVDDLARLAVEHSQRDGNEIVDAIGPETITYRELIMLIGERIGRRRPVFSAPPALVLALGWAVGWFQRDVTITREEIGGLMANLLVTGSPPSGTTRLSDWVAVHRDSLGRRYASELARRENRMTAYAEL